MKKVVLFGMLLPLLVSCMKEEEYVDYTAVDEKIISEYLQENNIDAERDASGLYYTVINEGTGDAIGADETQDDKVTFSYKGTLINGNEYNDSEGKNITNYLSQLPYGFQIGLSKINKQGEITLYIPSLLCRDPYGYSAGPENTVMIYELKVDRDQDDIDEDIIAAYLEENNITDAIRDESGLYYRIITEGEGPNVPENALIDVSYIGKLLDGTTFDEGTLNNQPLVNLIPAWKIGIPKLKKGSNAIFYCPSQMAYGSQEQEKIPANSVLVFDINVINF